MPAHSSVVKIRQDTPYRRLATNGGEKYGLSRHGLGRKDIVPNINFFCDVPVDANQMAPNVFVEGGSSPGDYVSLQAKMNALAVISNCPQLNNPCNSGTPTDIRVIVSRVPWSP
jgi:uncharacterized protein YcgI (DUF1989 family)